MTLRNWSCVPFCFNWWMATILRPEDTEKRKRGILVQKEVNFLCSSDAEYSQKTMTDYLAWWKTKDEAERPVDCDFSTSSWSRALDDFGLRTCCSLSCVVDWSTRIDIAVDWPPVCDFGVFGYHFRFSNPIVHSKRAESRVHSAHSACIQER